ncbi:MAG: substrate-binding domain-containing protein [Micromonosporaceae bacterium]|jgi:branched-chain amino acid transport system substrate-binding protein
MNRRVLVAAATAAVALSLSACTEPGSGGNDTEQQVVKVGVLTSTSGLLASYGQQFTEGFRAGLEYATGGSNTVGDVVLEVTYHDDATDPATATAVATDLIGQGYQIIAGTTSSGVAVQLAPLAEQNQVLYISGPAATDALTGINDYTFRSGRQTWQDVRAAASFLGDLAGSKVLVFAQDYDFGQSNVAAVEAVLGEAGGAEVSSVLVPLETTDFTPFVRQVVDAEPDMVFVAWAGDTTASMWQALSQQGLFDTTQVVTGLAERVGFPLFGDAAERIGFLSHYFAEATDNEPARALAEAVGTPDIFHVDGFVAAQMVVRAVEEGGTDVSAMISALEGWTFTSPKGESTIRPEDHALLQPMFQARLVVRDGEYVPELVATLTPDQVAPPVADGA